MDYLINPAKLAFRMADALDEAPLPESKRFFYAPVVWVHTIHQQYYIRRDHSGKNYVVGTGNMTTETFDGVTVGPVPNTSVNSSRYGPSHLASISPSALLRFLEAINHSITEIDARLIPLHFAPTQKEFVNSPVGKFRWICATQPCREAATKRRRGTQRVANFMLDAREQKRRHVIRYVTDPIQFSPPSVLLPHGGVKYQEGKERWDESVSPPS